MSTFSRRPNSTTPENCKRRIVEHMHRNETRKAVDVFAHMTLTYCLSDPQACMEAGLMIRDLICANRICEGKTQIEMSHIVATFNQLWPVVS